MEKKFIRYKLNIKLVYNSSFSNFRSSDEFEVMIITGQHEQK